MKRLFTVFSILLASGFVLPACGDEVAQAGSDTDTSVSPEALDEVGVGNDPAEPDASLDPDASLHHAAFLGKPFTEHALLDKLRALLSDS